jgi:hypothetical protein
MRRVVRGKQLWGCGALAWHGSVLHKDGRYDDGSPGATAAAAMAAWVAAAAKRAAACSSPASTQGSSTVREARLMQARSEAKQQHSQWSEEEKRWGGRIRAWEWRAGMACLQGVRDGSRWAAAVTCMQQVVAR